MTAGVVALSQWLMNIINNKITFRVTREVRQEAFSHLQMLPLAYLDAHPSGEIVSRMISDTCLLYTSGTRRMRRLPSVRCGRRRPITMRRICIIRRCTRYPRENIRGF